VEEALASGGVEEVQDWSSAGEYGYVKQAAKDCLAAVKDVADELGGHLA
jgi:hypothetical protein